MQTKIRRLGPFTPNKTIHLKQSILFVLAILKYKVVLFEKIIKG